MQVQVLPPHHSGDSGGERRLMETPESGRRVLVVRTLAALVGFDTIVTLGLVLVAGVQAILFLVQLKLMRESLVPAKEGAEAARDAALHIPVVERAYVSGGGAFTAQQIIDRTNNRILITPIDPFQLTVDNCGKTPARVIHIEVGFCDASSIPPAPKYTIT